MEDPTLYECSWEAFGWMMVLGIVFGPAAVLGFLIVLLSNETTYPLIRALIPWLPAYILAGYLISGVLGFFAPDRPSLVRHQLVQRASMLVVTLMIPSLALLVLLAMQLLVGAGLVANPALAIAGMTTLILIGIGCSGVWVSRRPLGRRTVHRWVRPFGELSDHFATALWFIPTAVLVFAWIPAFHASPAAFIFFSVLAFLPAWQASFPVYMLIRAWKLPAGVAFVAAAPLEEPGS